MANKCTVRRTDSLSLWRRRVTAGRRNVVVKDLRLCALVEEGLPAPDAKTVRAYRIAAHLLEKLGEPR